MIVGFSGTREGLSEPQVHALRSLLAELAPVVVHHGGAEGADTQFHLLALDTPSIREVFIHPCRDLVEAHWTAGAEDKTVTILPVHKPLVRNQHIVNEVELLLLGPLGFVEELRSGTWASARYMRKKGGRIICVLPDGSVRTESAKC